LRNLVPQEQKARLLEAGDFRIDLDSRQVMVRGSEIRLTPKEFDILIYLAQRAGKVVNHRALLASVWGSNSTEQPEYLRVFVGQLRKKIETDPSNPKYLLTEPWVGYRFDPGK
jgi:two-component system KDP operon response regulator KdpE